jgi:hypothetical protein
MELFTYEGVLRAVVDHVAKTGHQDIRMWDLMPEQLTGYACRECPPDGPEGTYLARVSSVKDIKGQWADLNFTDGRVRNGVIADLVKEGLHRNAVYRPTAWERVLKV